VAEVKEPKMEHLNF
jgi:hypothetical protein